jgi:predicted nucleic acid-binding protein
VIAVDSSVAVAAFASWHERHKPARRVLDRGATIVAHCALETYSVLTRLPPPHRAPATVVRDFLNRFPRLLKPLPDREYQSFLRDLPDHGVTGGSTYDALVAATAAHRGVVLATCDERALGVYERYGVRLEYV